MCGLWYNGNLARNGRARAIEFTTLFNFCQVFFEKKITPSGVLGVRG